MCPSLALPCTHRPSNLWLTRRTQALASSGVVSAFVPCRGQCQRASPQLLSWDSQRDCVGLWAPWTGHNKVTVAAGRWVADRSLVYLRRKERGARFRPPDSCYRTSYTCLCQGAGGRLRRWAGMLPRPPCRSLSVVAPTRFQHAPEPLPLPEDCHELLICCSCLASLDLSHRRGSCLYSFSASHSINGSINLHRLPLIQSLSPAPWSEVDAVQARLGALHEDACRQQRIMPTACDTELYASCARPGGYCICSMMSD